MSWPALTRDITARKAMEAEREQHLARERFLSGLDDALRPLIDPDAVAHAAAAAASASTCQVEQAAYVSVGDDQDTFDVEERRDRRHPAPGRPPRVSTVWRRVSAPDEEAGEPFVVEDSAGSTHGSTRPTARYRRTEARAWICAGACTRTVSSRR